VINSLFNVADIEKGVNALKNCKASGVDGLSKGNICKGSVCLHQ